LRSVFSDCLVKSGPYGNADERLWLVQLTDWNGERGDFAGVRDHGRNGHGQDNARAGTDPQQVFDRQQRRDAETRSFVLPNDVVTACGGKKRTEQCSAVVTRGRRATHWTASW